MASPENDESILNPMGLSMDPHQLHDKYDHLVDQVGTDAQHTVDHQPKLIDLKDYYDHLEHPDLLFNPHRYS